MSTQLSVLVSQTSLPNEQLLFGAAWIIGLCLIMVVVAQRAMAGKVPHVNRLEALDAMEMGIDRCVELGKPVYYEVSGARYGGDHGPMILAGISILGGVARYAAEKGATMIICYSAPQVLPAIEGQLKGVEEAVGKPGYFKDIRYLGSDAFSAAATSMNIIEENDCMCSIAMGSAAINILPIAEANRSKGCICIEGTAYMSQIHAMGLTTDYNLIGEQLYAAGAMYSKDPDTLSTLRINDIGKLTVIGLLPVLVAAVAGGVL